MGKQLQIKSKDGSKNLSEDHNFQFYHEYVRLFIANVVLVNQMKDLLQEKNDLTVKMVKLEKKSQELGDQYEDDEKKKRFRRTATQIDRHFRCPIENCMKSYGSEGSLNQHLKLKHPQYYDTLSHLKEEDEGRSERMSQVGDSNITTGDNHQI